MHTEGNIISLSLSLSHTHTHTLSLTGELGDYDPHKHEPGYVAEFNIVPKQRQNRDLEDRIADLHMNLVGKTNAEVEYLYLAYARR